MIVMIGKGVTSGVATSTEISAFAVIYALLVGGLAFRELTFKKVVHLFVKSASMTGVILFIVAAASSLSYALTIERIPHALATVLIDMGQHYGAITFVLLSALIMIVFGMVLEGAPGPDPVRPAADPDRHATRRQPAAVRHGHGLSLIHI